MKPSFTTRQSLLPVMLGSLLLAACGGGGGGSGGGGSATSGLSGTAAVGAPLVNATVTLKCNGQEASATTNAQGKWNAGIRENALPCAIEVSGGTVDGADFTGKFYSYAQSLGTVNVTPLTSLALARAVQSSHGKTPAYWFSHVSIGGDAPEGSVCVFTDTSTVAGQNVVINTCMVDVPQASCNGPEDITNPNGGPTVKRSYSYKACPEGAIVVDVGSGDPEDSYAPAALAAAVNDASDKLLQALKDSGYTVPADLDPFTTAFDAISGNAYDDLLEALRAALGAEADYEELESDFAANGETLPAAPEEPQQPGSDDTAPGTVHSALAKSYTLTFNKGGGAGCGSACSYTEGQQVAVVVGSDNSLTIAGKKLTAPFNRKFGGSPHLPEIIWKDGDIEYALSDNQAGTFNEINVGKAKAGGGIPDFIGQLRAPAVADDPVAKLAPLAGSYAPLYVAKSGNYTLPGQPKNDDPVTVTISEAGVITVAGEVFDPAASNVTFNDFNKPSLHEQRYAVSRKDSDTILMRVDVQLVENEVVGWRMIKTTQLGGGTSGVSYVTLEERPLPAAQSTLIDALKAMGELTLTVVQDYSGAKKCTTTWLTVNGDGKFNTPWHYYMEKPYAIGDGRSHLEREEFSRSTARYAAEDGNETLSFTRNQLVKRADGKIDVMTRTPAVATFATNDPAQISAAGCTAAQ